MSDIPPPPTTVKSVRITNQEIADNLYTPVHNNPDYHVIKKSDVDGDVIGALLREIDVTLDYFFVEFPEQEFPQVWNDPISHFSGGTSPNELLKIRNILIAQSATDIDVATKSDDDMRVAINESIDVLDDVLSWGDTPEHIIKNANKAMMLLRGLEAKDHGEE